MKNEDLVLIEKATPKDAKGLLEYLKQIGSESDNLSFGAEGLGFSVEAEAQYLAEIGNSRDSVMLIAKENGKIIGSASLTRLPRRMKHRGDFSVSVLMEYHNRGIGTALAEGIIDFARENNFAVIDLQVRSDNAAAIHLYEKLGFVKTGTHPSFFEIDGDGISFDYMYLRIE
ncbi:MAG: GNAT family N-acetyltransferase [Clostridia bacterium]|nr:GNAT family N-acetyltransferase [Clostridia bacterium]